MNNAYNEQWDMKFDQKEWGSFILVMQIAIGRNFLRGLRIKRHITMYFDW